MSHITTSKTKTVIMNEQWIKQAIALMIKDCPAGIYNGISHPAISFEQTNPDLIQVRYAPIEGYQTKGNLRFIRNGDHWDLQLDTWRCDEEIARVKKSFEVSYTLAGCKAWSASRGYSQTESEIKNGRRLTAVKW